MPVPFTETTTSFQNGQHAGTLYQKQINRAFKTSSMSAIVTKDATIFPNEHAGSIGESHIDYLKRTVYRFILQKVMQVFQTSSMPEIFYKTHNEFPKRPNTAQPRCQPKSTCMQIQVIGTCSHRRVPTIINRMFCGQRGCLNCSVEYCLKVMYNHTRFACRYIPTFLHATV